MQSNVAERFRLIRSANEPLSLSACGLLKKRSRDVSVDLPGTYAHWQLSTFSESECDRWDEIRLIRGNNSLSRILDIKLRLEIEVASCAEFRWLAGSSVGRPRSAFFNIGVYHEFMSFLSSQVGMTSSADDLSAILAKRRLTSSVVTRGIPPDKN